MSRIESAQSQDSGHGVVCVVRNRASYLLTLLRLFVVHDLGMLITIYPTAVLPEAMTLDTQVCQLICCEVSFAHSPTALSQLDGLSAEG